MEYGCENMDSFSSGVSTYSVSSKSSSHIKPNESGGGAGKKATNRPYANKSAYEKGMSTGKKSSMQ